MPSPIPSTVTAVAAEAPIVDLRPHLPWRRRWRSRVSTGAVWLGTLSLVGPLKIAGVILATSLVAPPVLLLERARRQQQDRTVSVLVRPAAGLAGLVRSEGLPRALVAERLGLPEAQLFRARHAAICTVHHDDGGSIVGLEWPCPAPVALVGRADAHPVG